MDLYLQWTIASQLLLHQDEQTLRKPLIQNLELQRFEEIGLLRNMTYIDILAALRRKYKIPQK